MRKDATKALVLQGGGALGAYELGVARVLYGERGYAPNLIAGVSIGAISAVLLARPRKDRSPLETLEAFWKKVMLPADFWLPLFRPYASLFGDPAFFRPRLDVAALPFWTSLYDTTPLRETLKELVDLDALKDPEAWPQLLVTATSIEDGQIVQFDSSDDGLTLDHIIASGSLPPNFPITTIKDKHSKERHYWDGGIFDNTPLGAVIERMDPRRSVEQEREIIVVNLFPNKGEVPRNMAEVGQRMLNMLFANKTQSDLDLMKAFNNFAGLIDLIATDDRWEALRGTQQFIDANKGYITVPNIVDITRTTPAAGTSSGDFTARAITELAEQGARDARKRLGGGPADSGERAYG
jgi:predicted acylesterase/phospholipase RssA